MATVRHLFHTGLALTCLLLIGIAAEAGQAASSTQLTVTVTDPRGGRGD